MSRVALLTPAMGVGGTEASTVTLARALLDQGWEAEIVATPGPMAVRAKEYGVPLTYLPIAGRGPGGLFRGAVALRGYFLERRPAIVESQMVVPALMAALAIRMMRRRPVLVWHCRGVKDQTYRVAGLLFRYVVDGVVANSQFERSRLIKGGFSPDRVEVIYNAPNLRPVGPDLHANDGSNIWNPPPKEGPIIGIVGRLVPKKGYFDFVDMIAIVTKREPCVRFLVVGDGPLRPKICAYAKRKGLDDRIFFAGHVQDLALAYHYMDIVVSASHQETFGNTCIEGMVLGKPVVATAVGAVPEIIEHDRTGLLVPPRDVAGLAEAILGLLADPARVSQLGNAGRKHVQANFSPERLGRAASEYYLGLLKQRREA